MAEQNPTTPKAPQAPKRKGPIRWEAIIPFTIIVALFYVYMHFFFDGHMRLLAQWGLTKAMGVQVDIGSIESSFFNAHISIKNIEVTNSETPTKNSISIGDIRFGMLWDALLRAKVVVNEAVVEQIEFGKPRKSAGWVAPPEPPPVDDGQPGAVDKLKNAAIQKVQTEYNDNIFGDIAAMLGGGDVQVQLNKLQDSLTSKKLAADIDANVKAKEKTWNERMKTLPKPEEFERLNARLKAVKTGGFKTPQELQQSLQEIDAIFKEADAKIKVLQSARTDFDADLAKINADVKSLDGAIKTDIKSLESHFKIPKIDAKAMTIAVFRKYFDPYLSKFQVYKALADKYVPPNLMKKGEPDPSLQPRPRSKGVSYEFGRPNSYPLFWIKRTAVSSQAGTSPYSGNVAGEILDITTNQVLTGKPTIARVKGDFPSMELRGLNTELTIDNRKEDSLISLMMSLNSYPIEGRELLANDDVKLAFAKAAGSLDVKAQLKALRDLSLGINNRFNNLNFEVSAKNEVINSILKNVFAGLPQLTVDGKIAGVLPSVSLDIESNLGPELQKGFEKQISAKIAEARAKVDAYIQAEVGKLRDQVNAEVTKLRTQVDGEIKKLQAQADAQKKQAEAQADKAKKDTENKAKGQLENEAKKAAEELKKKFGF